MALSNWLTRDEWNAAYFLGMDAAEKRAQKCADLGEQLLLGIAALHLTGYKFTGIEVVNEPGMMAGINYRKVRQCSEGNEQCLVEFMDGTLDLVGRAREFLKWAEGHPNLDVAWLHELMRPQPEGSE